MRALFGGHLKLGFPYLERSQIFTWQFEKVILKHRTLARTNLGKREAFVPTSSKLPNSAPTECFGNISPALE
jgi:hypothetical protein